MNTPKTIILGFLFAGAVLAPGLVSSNRRTVESTADRHNQTAAIDSAVTSQIARAQAAVALSQTSGAASRLPFGL